MFNFNKTRQFLLNCLNAAELAVKNKDYDNILFRVPPGWDFPSNKDINIHKMQALMEITREDSVKTNLPEKYILEEIENILFFCF